MYPTYPPHCGVFETVENDVQQAVADSNPALEDLDLQYNDGQFTVKASSGNNLHGTVFFKQLTVNNRCFAVNNQICFLDSNFGDSALLAVVVTASHSQPPPLMVVMLDLGSREIWVQPLVEFLDMEPLVTQPNFKSADDELPAGQLLADFYVSTHYHIGVVEHPTSRHTDAAAASSTAVEIVDADAGVVDASSKQGGKLDEAELQTSGESQQETVTANGNPSIIDIDAESDGTAALADSEKPEPDRETVRKRRGRPRKSNSAIDNADSRVSGDYHSKRPRRSCPSTSNFKSASITAGCPRKPIGDAHSVPQRLRTKTSTVTTKVTKIPDVIHRPEANMTTVTSHVVHQPRGSPDTKELLAKVLARLDRLEHFPVSANSVGPEVAEQQPARQVDLLSIAKAASPGFRPVLPAAGFGATQPSSVAAYMQQQTAAAMYFAFLGNLK